MILCNNSINIVFFSIYKFSFCIKFLLILNNLSNCFNTIHTNAPIEKFNTKTAAIDRSILGLDTQTKNLLNILNNDQDRGKWADFKVKDLIDSKGFVEGVHYDYQPRTAEG